MYTKIMGCCNNPNCARNGAHRYLAHPKHGITKEVLCNAHTKGKESEGYKSEPVEEVAEASLKCEVEKCISLGDTCEYECGQCNNLHSMQICKAHQRTSFKAFLKLVGGKLISRREWYPAE